MKSNVLNLEEKGFQSLSEEEAMNIEGGVAPLVAWSLAAAVKGGKIYLGGIAVGSAAKMTYNTIKK